jgi:hypothetical protein
LVRFEFGVAPFIKPYLIPIPDMNLTELSTNPLNPPYPFFAKATQDRQRENTASYLN